MPVYKVQDREGRGGAQGSITFDPETQKVTVDLQLGQKRNKLVKEFFTTPREFRIPESDQIDDYRVEVKKPIDGEDYFNMAMTELYGATGVYVLWGE